MTILPPRKITTSLLLALLTISAASTATAASQLTPQQKAMHTSPIPGLPMMIKKNAALLKLDSSQISAVDTWIKNNKQTAHELVDKIFSTEKAITKGVMADMPMTELQTLKEDLLSARAELFDLKTRAVNTMKTTLNQQQWSKLLGMREKSARVLNSNFRGNEVQSFLRIALMPKLMLIVLLHTEELELTEKQYKALESWRFENMGNWSQLFDQVLKGEKALTDNALAFTDKEQLLQDYQSMLAKRKSMAEMSLACRDNMKSILNETQWALVVEKFNSYR